MLGVDGEAPNARPAPRWRYLGHGLAGSSMPQARSAADPETQGEDAAAGMVGGREEADQSEGCSADGNRGMYERARCRRGKEGSGGGKSESRTEYASCGARFWGLRYVMRHKHASMGHDTYKHIRARIHMRTRMHAHAHTYTDARIRMHILILIYIRTRTGTRVCMTTEGPVLMLVPFAAVPSTTLSCLSPHTSAHRSSRRCCRSSFPRSTAAYRQLWCHTSSRRRGRRSKRWRATRYSGLNSSCPTGAIAPKLHNCTRACQWHVCARGPLQV